jgi:NDP-sugar pyrophosphorylase family protein
MSFAERRRRRRLTRAMDTALAAPAAREFASYGSGSHVIAPVRVDGVQFMHLGDGVVVLDLGWLIAKPAPDGTAPRLVIGDGCRIGRFVKLVCTGELTVGPRCLFSDHVYVSDTGYRHDRPGTPIAQQGLDEPQPVRIGADVFLGFGAKVLPGVTIGDGAHVGAGAVVLDDVPAGAVVIGNPARQLAG